MTLVDALFKDVACTHCGHNGEWHRPKILGALDPLTKTPCVGTNLAKCNVKCEDFVKPIQRSGHVYTVLRER